MENPNALLSQIEAARLWNYFHKDWLLQIRLAILPQLPAAYRVFIESEVVLITPDAWDSPGTSILPDVAISPGARQPTSPDFNLDATAGSAAVIEAEEPCETETHYTLIVRRAPENVLVAAAELVSPSNKGLGNRLDQQKYLRKRGDYFDAGVNLLEIDSLTEGQRVLPDKLAGLRDWERVAWTAYHTAGSRRFRGHGWNSADPLPIVDWPIDSAQVVSVDLGETLREAVEFNQWEALVNRGS